MIREALIATALSLLPAEVAIEGIMISPEERLAIIDLVKKQDLTIELLQKALENQKAKTGCS